MTRASFKIREHGARFPYETGLNLVMEDCQKRLRRIAKAMAKSQVLCEKVEVPVSIKPSVKCSDAGAKFTGFSNSIFSGYQNLRMSTE